MKFVMIEQLVEAIVSLEAADLTSTSEGLIRDSLAAFGRAGYLTTILHPGRRVLKASNLKNLL